jgi:hypothetical protein
MDVETQSPASAAPRRRAAALHVLARVRTLRCGKRLRMLRGRDDQVFGQLNLHSDRKLAVGGVLQTGHRGGTPS